MGKEQRVLQVLKQHIQNSKKVSKYKEKINNALLNATEDDIVMSLVQYQKFIVYYEGKVENEFKTSYFSGTSEIQVTLPDYKEMLATMITNVVMGHGERVKRKEGVIAGHIIMTGCRNVKLGDVFDYGHYYCYAKIKIGNKEKQISIGDYSRQYSKVNIMINYSKGVMRKFLMFLLGVVVVIAFILLISLIL